jgi:hypothetical protein
MDYRQSSYRHNGIMENEASINESSFLQLDILNSRFKEIAKRLLDDRDMADFEPQMRRQSHSVFELGTLCDNTVMTRLVHLEGYRALHATLKKINADFHFQVLPSAGMVRPTPCLLLIIEQDKNYASNLDEKNRHMYPGFFANDNGAGFNRVRKLDINIDVCSVFTQPLHFNFS